jgi:DNA repair exonuclease SbcCD ATPase subunit
MPAADSKDQPQENPMSIRNSKEPADGAGSPDPQRLFVKPEEHLVNLYDPPSSPAPESSASPKAAPYSPAATDYALQNLKQQQSAQHTLDQLDKLDETLQREASKPTIPAAATGPLPDLSLSQAEQFLASAISPQSSDTENVLQDVQSTLDSLAGMAQGLSQQRLESIKEREALDARLEHADERERLLNEREEALRQWEVRLQQEKAALDRLSEQQAATLAERSATLQALAETVDSRDRSTTKRAEVLQNEQDQLERKLAQMRVRHTELDGRETMLLHKDNELTERFKQLVDAKERFSAIVRSFNETVRFNTALSAISKTVGGRPDGL